MRQATLKVLYAVLLKMRPRSHQRTLYLRNIDFYNETRPSTANNTADVQSMPPICFLADKRWAVSVFEFGLQLVSTIPVVFWDTRIKPSLGQGKRNETSAAAKPAEDHHTSSPPTDQTSSTPTADRQVQHFVNLKVRISLQAQHFVHLNALDFKTCRSHSVLSDACSQMHVCSDDCALMCALTFSLSLSLSISLTLTLTLTLTHPQSHSHSLSLTLIKKIWAPR